jgi:hypothetical protein
VWVDGSGSYLLPAVASTWAPVGKTPILRNQLSRPSVALLWRDSFIS